MSMHNLKNNIEWLLLDQINIKVVKNVHKLLTLLLTLIGLLHLQL